MKINRSFIKLAMVSLAFLTISSCSPSYNSVKKMQKLEENVSSPRTKEEISEAIKKYEKRAMDLVSTEAQVGSWYKILGIRYLDEGLYGRALESFQKAVNYYPDNANLYYYLGVSAGYVAHSKAFDVSASSGRINTVQKEEYLRLSEAAYLQALTLNPLYYRAMYGIGVLYVFELPDESEKGIPYLERFLETQKKDTNAMFVLARAYYVSRDFEKAAALYEKIIQLSPNKEKVEEATRNLQTVLDAQHTN